MKADPSATPPSPHALLNLHDGDSRVALCPGLGATIAQYRWRDHDILRPAPDGAVTAGLVRQMACYPLVPYSNRIGFAELRFGGARIRLRANAPPEPHALHGFGWQRAWQVLAHDATTVEMQLRHRPDEDWPFPCEASYRVELRNGGLHLRLAVRNCGEGAMPAGLGLHPFFPLDADTALEAHWGSMWPLDQNKLPTTVVPTPAEADFRKLRAVGRWQVDNCFCEWDGRAMLVYSTHRVFLQADNTCSRIVCYAPGDERRFIALEPVTHVSNAFAFAARGVAGTGMRILAPGASVELSLSITPQGVDR